MQFRLSIPTIIALTCFIACGRSSQKVAIKEQAPAVIHIEQDTLTTAINTKDIVELTEFMKISARDSVFISGNNILTPTHNGYIFADKKLSWAVTLDNNGRIIKEIGKMGMQKGAFPSIEALRIDSTSNEILIYSNEKQSLLRYSPNGDYLKEVKLPFYGYSFGVLDKDRLVFYLNQNTNDLSQQYNALITDREGNIIQRLFPIKLLPHEVYSYSGFLQQSPGGLLLGESFADTVYRIDHNNVYPGYAVKFSNGSIPDTAKTSTLKLIKAFEKASFIESLNETDNYVIIRYMEKDRQKLALYNKKTGQAISSTQLQQKHLERLLYNVIGTDQEHFYATLSIEGFDFFYRNKPNMLDSLKAFSEKLYTTCLSNTQIDNPIIVKFKPTF